MSTSQSGVDDSFAEQKLLDSFLRGTKLMRIIEEKADNFIKTYTTSKNPEDARAPIILELPLQYRDFVERSPTLLHCIIEEPIEFLETAKYLIYSIITSILKQSPDSAPKVIDAEQIHLHCRFLGLPVQEDLLYNFVPNQYPGGLSVVVGVLSGITEPETYTVQSIWYCNTGCQANKIKKGEITKGPICYTCSRPMNEYSKLRCMGKYRLIKVFSVESVSTPRIFDKIFRSQGIRLIDYTYDCDLTLGATYIITGHFDFKTIEFVAWNLTKQ